MSKLSNNPALYTSDRQDWQTPPDFIEKLLAFNKREYFDLDPCCTDHNVPAAFHYTEEDDGLSSSWLVDWNSMVFMNPPYDQLEKWVQKAVQESKKGCRIWGLFPARLDTKYWLDDVFQERGFVFFLKARLCFWQDGAPYLVPEKKKGVPTGKMIEGTAPFPAALVYWGDDHEPVGNLFGYDSPWEGVLVQGHKKIKRNKQLRLEV